jgi:hypothetical protein
VASWEDTVWAWEDEDNAIRYFRGSINGDSKISTTKSNSNPTVAWNPVDDTAAYYVQFWMKVDLDKGVRELLVVKHADVKPHIRRFAPGPDHLSHVLRFAPGPDRLTLTGYGPGRDTPDVVPVYTISKKEWNFVEVVAGGSRTTVYINGLPALDVSSNTAKRMRVGTRFGPKVDSDDRQGIAFWGIICRDVPFTKTAFTANMTRPPTDKAL